MDFAEIMAKLLLASKGQSFYLHFGRYGNLPALQLDGVDLGTPSTLAEAVAMMEAYVPDDPLARALTDLQKKYGAAAINEAILTIGR